MHERVGIVGCGLIGASWAGLFAASGRDVFAWDVSERARTDFVQNVEAILGTIRKLELFGSRKHGSLHVATSIEEVAARTTLVQENAPEDLELKRRLYAQIEAAAAPETIIASSTSSLTWSSLSAGMMRPQRLITAHPFNPPHLMPLVELFGEDRNVLEGMKAFYASLGRVPVVLKKEAVGHIANRLASALWREAVNIVAEDIADVSDVDLALVHGPGLRWAVMGAHMSYHLGGGPGGIAHYLAHLGPSQERRWTTLGTPKLTPDVCEKLKAGIEKEAQSKSIAELEAERDRALIAILESRRRVLG